MRRLSSFLLVGLLSAGFLFAGVAFSATVKKNPAGTNQLGKKKTTKTTGNATAAVQRLTSVRNTLNQADHDYKGHRAAAVHQISHAIHLLQYGKHHPNPGQHFKSGGNKEAQSASDAQLKQALTALQGVTVPAGPHAAQVHAAIAKAIADLNTALKVA